MSSIRTPEEHPLRELRIQHYIVRYEKISSNVHILEGYVAHMEDTMWRHFECTITRICNYDEIHDHLNQNLWDMYIPHDGFVWYRITTKYTRIKGPSKPTYIVPDIRGNEVPPGIYACALGLATAEIH